MGEWKEYRLGELITLNYGKGLRSQDRIHGSYPVYSSAGITGAHEIPLVNSEGIIIGRKGSIGTVYYSNKPFWCIDTAYYIIPEDSKYILKFLYYRLKTMRLYDLNEDSAVPGLNRTTFYGLRVLFPPLEEQKEIAEILSSLDDKIDLLHRQNKTLEEMAQTLFRQWFIEEAQDDWEEVELGEVVEVTTGKGLKKEEYDWEGMYPILGANGEIGRTDKFNFREKLILTGRVGTLGRVYFNNSKSWITDNVLIIKPHNNDIFYPIYFILKNLDYENLNAGSTQPLITQSDIKRIKIKIPNRKMCSVYASFFEVHFEKIQKNLPKIDIIIRLKTIISDFLLSKD